MKRIQNIIILILLAGIISGIWLHIRRYNALKQKLFNAKIAQLETPRDTVFVPDTVVVIKRKYIRREPTPKPKSSAGRSFFKRPQGFFSLPGSRKKDGLFRKPGDYFVSNRLFTDDRININIMAFAWSPVDSFRIKYNLKLKQYFKQAPPRILVKPSGKVKPFLFGMAAGALIISITK